MKENSNFISIVEKLTEIEKELSIVRSDIEHELIQNAKVNKVSSDIKFEYTLEDLYKAFGPSKQTYAIRLKNSLQRNGINTLGQFLTLTPGQLFSLDGVGNVTLQHTNKALKKMGINW